MGIQRLFVTDKEVAQMLGQDLAWFKQNATTLEKQYSFPPIDPAVGKRHRASIEEWASERTQRLRSGLERLIETNRENEHEF